MCGCVWVGEVCVCVGVCVWVGGVGWGGVCGCDKDFSCI